MVQSIERAMHIIEVIVSDPLKEQWAISEIAEQTKLPISTVHRLMSTLIKFGLITQITETKQYKIGYTWMEIGLRMLDRLDFRAIARPVMERLALEIEESIYLNIPSGTNAIIVERVDSPAKVKFVDNLGEQIPLHIGAANKTMLANLPVAEATNIIQKLIRTENQRRAIFDQLTLIQKQGFAVSYGEKTEGTASVAAPIIGFNQKVFGALSCGVISYRITENRLAWLIQKVKEGAAEISTKIGRLS